MKSKILLSGKIKKTIISIYMQVLVFMSEIKFDLTLK